MKKLALIICGLALVSSAVFAQVELRPLMPPYWVVGTVPNYSPAILAEGRMVVFYKNDADLSAGNYAQGVITGNKFILNAFGIWPASLDVGTAYKVAVVRDPVKDASITSLGPRTVTISGKGWDEVAGLTLAYSVDVVLKGTEPAPIISVTFGKRLYQPAVFGVGPDKKEFIVSEKTPVRIEVTIPNPYRLDDGTYSHTVSITDPVGGVQTLDLSKASGFKASATGVKPLVIESTLALKAPTDVDKALYTIGFRARSAGDLGTPTLTATQAAVTLMGGRLQAIDVLTFPTPFRVKTDRNVTIQYTLSKDANIEITIFSVEGRIVKRIFCASAKDEGGFAGINKVLWNGMTDAGMQAGAGVYVGSIVAKEENRVLARFRVAIID